MRLTNTFWENGRRRDQEIGEGKCLHKLQCADPGTKSEARMNTRKEIETNIDFRSNIR